MKVVFINGKRNGYSVDQCGETLTVRELTEVLEGFDDDTPVYLNNDSGYTYGSITDNDVSDCDVETDDE